ncbi:uncharacterized protein LOC119018069 [Acanthopagrus latus]|uniref:uncharacterized protein LOC119018069 n=1 Tax=Acanthopagrus latus TaxID=8177 RepID=UPI00187C39AD|nr:uncharacterized protein LOC119018069 [Acanthopagrus latus]
MWSLGCAMFEMIRGVELFKGYSAYETTPSEFFKRHHKLAKNKRGLKCLDDLKAMRLEEENNTEAVEREQCVELLKAMLAFDADERITPCEILTHPFITKVYRNVQTLNEDFECEPPAAGLDDEDNSNIQPGDCPPSPEIRSGGMILVQPHSSAENSTLLEDQESTVSEPTAAPLRDQESSNIQPDDCTPSPEILPSGEILVPPVTAENTTLLEDQENTVSEPTAAPLKAVTSNQMTALHLQKFFHQVRSLFHL